MNKLIKSSGSIALIAIVFHLGCHPHYISSNFAEKTATHQTIAVVPIEMFFSGKMPKGWTEHDILAIEEIESKAFQISFFNELLRSTKNGKKPIKVDIQHYNKTLQILSENAISVRDSWNLSPEELATLLGVDAIVKARIEKARFMSDFTSYGIDVATEIVNILTNYQAFPWLPVSPIAKEVIADYSLVNGSDGITLWSVKYQNAADWSQSSEQIIDGISRRAARKFPYRNK